MTQIIIQNGNTCQLEGPQRILLQLYNEYKIKHPNAWHIQMYQKRNSRWDGYIKYISQTGRFKIGLLSKVVDSLKSLNEEVRVIDKRLKFNGKNVTPVIPDIVGDLTLYPRQKKSLEKLLFNRICGVPFTVGCGDLSVGFGKSILFAAIHEAYQRKLKTILLLNDADLFNQFKREIPPMLPGEDISFIQGGPKSNRIGNFNVAMVQSLSRNLKAYSYMLSQIDICLIDEADIIDNNTYKSVIEQLYNTQVRIGLSGTIYLSKLKKDQVHNMNVMSFIGPKLDVVTLKDQMKSGRATPVIVKMVPVPQVSVNHQYQEEYQENIVNNPKAYQISWERIKYNASYGRMPMLIVTKIIDHSKTLYKFLQEKNKAMGNPYKIAQVDHTTSNRKAILESFRLGEIDILVSTTIISRGKNFPTLKYLQNAAGMDSNEKSIQILGRLVRQHKSKNRAYLDDLAYQGSYLSRHSKHRTRYYKNEKLKVIVLSRVSPLYTKVNSKDYSQMRNESEGERGKRIKEML